MMTDEEAGSHKLRRFQNTDGIHTDIPDEPPNVAPGPMCDMRCVCLRTVVGLAGKKAEEN